MATVSNILFVHGAWANASSWAKVLPLIEAAGLTGTAVSLSLATLADDVAIVKRALDLIEGPVLLVGHSYGGAVMTEAGADPKVDRLCAIACRITDDTGRSVEGLATDPAHGRGASSGRACAGDRCQHHPARQHSAAGDKLCGCAHPG
jgi:pimeloyl-ACP methyl ester carboxylesterase